MAERPLYTLYKNLKAQNYDVPDDYNKFESALTRDGKGGADNRHAIYENLKAQNFDVPDTYERFYSALFEPRSKTSSRAKGGSVPMTAADRARFSAGAQAISASAQQTMNNAGRYNKLKQRKQKQQKDFGRVNLGTHQTPYGGDANNVVKDDFAYNPETGKAGAYITSDNEKVYTQNDAEQKQNLLDKYGEEWNNAVDMGIVPSELDKADPDLSDTDVAMRQMERRQEWLNENQDRRSNELNESMHLQGSPFVASGGAVAPSSFNTAISNEANRLSDVEYGAYNTAKAYNQMLRTTLLQELKEQNQRNENAGWWKDKWNDVSNYFGAMFNTMLDPKLYSQGVMDAAIANNVIQVKKGMEDGTIKKGSNAGNVAQAMLGAIQQQQAEAAKQQQYGTKAYQYGDMSGRSLKFMGDFALSGWRNVMTTGFTKAGEKVGEKMALGALGKWFTKNTGRVLGDIAGSAALAATNQLGSTYNNVIERYVGMNNENGGVTQGKNGDLKFNEGVSLGKAIKDGFGSATIENFSEMFGEYLPGAPKLLSKLGLSKVSAFFEKIGNNAYYKWLSNATNKSGIQGVMAEISEEEFGTALHAAWGDGDGSWSDFNVFTNPDAREKQIDTCLGMFYSVGFMQAPRTAVGAINAVQYFNIKHQVAKADKFGQVMFNDKWEEIKSKIDVTTNADLTKTVLDATRSDSMTAKQKGAVINYAMFLSKLRGFNQAADAKTKDKVEEGDTAPTLSNDLDDAYTEGHNADDADKHNIQLEQNDKANELAAMLHITPEQLHDMADEDLEAMTGQDDKLDQAIYDYQVSTAKYQGVMDGAQDEVDMAAQQAAMETDNMTDLSRGTVRKATIKATGGLEDYEVYIISGNIATHDDGSIDVGNSDDMIIYYDPTTGRKEHADAMMFADLIEELPAADVKAQAIIDAKENAIKKVAGIIDGTVEVGSQFSVTDADGTEHTYEVLADNGDGTAMITIDGNVPTELVKGENVQIPYSFADLQQMKDAEDLKRLEAAKAEREQMENERAEQQTMETQKTQQTEETQQSFDFTQILNDNGNVVLVDVLGKDGNTKYPNSQLFLIRDSGAKAKVMELTSDGLLIPHAVNKKDVRTATTITLDEYKQAFAGSSMIEDNSGTIEVDDNTQPLSEADADNIIAQMESSAEVVPELELTPDNWAAEFGEDGIVSTPIGDVKMGENQVAKLFEKGRSKEFGMIKPTLTNPDVIIEVPSHSADGNEERSSSYLFIKTFLGKNGKKVYYFKSVTIKKDGLEISISSHYDRAKRVKEALMKGKLLYRKNDGAQTEQNQPSTSVTTSQEDAAGSSESKDTNISANGNENNESLTFEDGTPIPVDENGETDLSQTDAAHAAEWYDNNLGEDADDWLDGEIKKAKKVLEQAQNKKVTGTKPSELVASKKEKEAAIADAQAHYDSAISIRDSLKERRIAKEENTPEGRKNLIDKARRKFARLKSAVKNDAEAVAQLYNETVGTLLHRLYDATGIDVTDTIPLTAEEYVASNLGAHSLNYEGTETSKGVKQETGLSREDFAKTQLLAAYGKGTTIDALVHSLWENRPSNLDSLDTQDIRNALLDIITSGFKASESRNYIENLRIAQAESALEEQKKAADNAAFAEEKKAKQEEEKKKDEEEDEETSPLEGRITETDEESEVDGEYGITYNKVYLIDGDKRVTKVDEPDEKGDYTGSYYMYDGKRFGDLFEVADYIDGNNSDNINEKTNEQTKFPDKLKEGSKTIEVPEDATDDAPLGKPLDESDLRFSSKGNDTQQTTIDSDADVEKNKVDDVKVVDNIVSKKTRKTLEKIAKIMGANIQWLYSNKQFNGRFDEKTNTIYLTLDSSITEGVQFIFGHEMTHEMRTKNPAAYDELKTLVKDMMGEDIFSAETDKMQQRYKKGGARYWNNRNAIEEEVVADQLGVWIRDANYAHTLLLKMSHPLLARLHEIVNRFLMALHGIEIFDDMNLILRSIEQAYVKTAKGEVTNSETGEDVSFSLRQKPEPKKKGIGYKVFVLKDGKLYPPMVANPNGAATPVGVWLDADAAPIAGESKTGRPQVKQGGKGTQGGSGKLAYRPGWHLGVVPYAIQFNRKDADGNKTLFPKNFVFAEVEYAADVDYQEEARQEGINPSGKYQHSLAGLKHLPTDGYYMYRTNPNPETDPWVITGAMKVNRILTRAEQAELVKNAGREPQQIQEGDIVTDGVVNSINQEIADAPKFSLKKEGLTPEIANTPVNIVDADEEHGFKNYAEAREWAKKNIVRTYNDEETGGKGEINISNTAVGKYLSEKAIDKSISKDVHMSVLKVLPSVLRESVDAYQHGDRKKVNNVRSEKFGINPDVMIHRCFGAVNIGGKVYGVKITLKENVKTRENKKLYSYEATKIELLDGKNEGVTMTPSLNSNNSITVAKIAKVFETTKKNGEKVEVEEPKTFEEFLNHPSLKFSIKNEEQRKAAEDAYEYASKLRPNKYAQYALVDMSNPSNSPEYYEKKVLADRWRRFYNKAVHNELDDVYKDAWGNYKLFDLDRPFADQVNEVKGDVPSEFNAPDVVANKNADNESGAEYHEYNQGGLSSVTYKDRYKAFKQREANREKVAGLKKKRKETEDSYNSKSKERAEYHKQLMKEYMDKHKMTEEYEIPDDDWDDLRSKSFEKYQDELDSLFNKYKDLDRQIKAVAEPRFSLKDEKTLAGVHNITEEKLLKAIKQGGLANPSVAVIDSSKQNHEDYGDISLILPSDKVAKRTGKNAGTWQGDAWTPTYPQVERQMSNKGAEKASKDVASVPNDMYSEVRRGLDRWLDGGEPNSAMAYMFLHEKGVAPEPKNIQHKYSDEAYNELKTITTGDFNIYGIGKSDAQKVLDMYIEAKFDGDKALYEEKTKAWLERNKAIVDAGTKGGMRYAIAKENVELYDEYGFNYKGVQTFVRDVEYDHRRTGVDMNATLNEVEDYIKTNNLTDEFNTWLEGKEKEYGIKEVIFDGFTPSGNRRYVPNTLENVSKIMKKQGRNGATGTSVSFQNFAAKLMPSYGTLKDIRSKKGLLTSDHEDLDKFNEKWANVFFELGMKCQPDATGTFDDYGLARLSEAAMTSDPQAYLKKEYNVDFSDEDTKRLKEMVKAIKEEYPAMYFETKFERPVGFDEFSSAVVPTTASNEVKQALQNAGVQIYEYDKEKEGDRSRAFNEAINSSDNIRFSLKAEKEKIVDDAKADGTYMTAPNGEKTKLNAEQWATVRTTNFKNWFGDWENDPENASKVVDENGEPMVVWHGRSAEFNTFEKKEGVRFIMGLEDKVKAEGFFFSPDKGLAEEFASNSSRHRGGKANVVPCFLNIRKPMDLTGEDYDRIYEDVTGWEYMVGMDTQDNLWGIMDEEGMADKIKEKGYDGAIFVEEVDDSYEPTKISYCALDANQIKSAENNNGDFSADNNDIRFSLKSMMAKPDGWKQANKKAIHIAEAIERDPKFSLKNLDGTLIKAGTYFSGGGLVEEGLKGIIAPVVAVEYDEKISGVYRNNFGQHIVTADVRDVDPRELVKQIDGEVEYFHASPVCKNYSQAKSNHAEVELDKETAASTAEFINAVKPKVVTIENVKGYKDSDAMKTITDALDANGYTWDADVYNAADYGGYTNRERLIVRAVRDGKLPEKPKKMARKSGWYEAVADIIPTLTEKKNGVAPWMDIRLKADGIDWRNIDKPLYVMGSAYADGKVPHAFADELLPTLRTKSGDVIVMPDGKVYRAMGRVLARVSGVSDDYKMPFSENLSHTIIGNGIPTQLTEHVIAPLLTGSDPKFSIRTYHGTGASFDKFDLSHALEGEGSESFGHGVYVTNSSKIGREYAQRAKNRKMEDLYKNMRYPDGVKGDIFKRRVFGEMVNDVATGGSVESAKEFAKKRVGADANDIQRTLEKLKDREKGTEYEQNLKDRLAEYKEGLKWIDSLDEDYLTQGNANRYDVDIPDDNGSNYLDWEGIIPDSLDKQKVAEDAYKVVSDNQGFNDFKATPLNDFIAHTLKTYVNTTDVAGRVEKLKSDIKDVIENYVADDDVLALNEYLKDATPDDVLATIWYNDLVRDIKNADLGEELYRKLSTYVGDNAASQILSDNGLVGIKYPAGMIHGGAKEGDYNYVIFDENNANIVGNTRFSLRYDQFEHDLNQWKKDNNLPKDAQRPTIPQRNAGESAVDFLKRVDEYRKQMALWKTAPTYEQHLLSDDTALGEFNRELQRGSVLKRIAFQDSMLAIRKAQEAIMKEVGVDRLNMAEDAYTAENRSHGKGKNEFEEYNNEFLQPLRKAYHQMKKILGDSYDNVRIYMMAKHGLERDAQMAFKKSLDADFEDVAQRSAAYRAYKGDMNRITNDSDLEFGRVDFNTWRQRDNALRTKYSPSYMDYRYDENGIAYDYSGLSALFGGSDFEEAAHKLVRDIESSHVAEVQDLWNATNAATKKILRDGYKAGMMSKDTYLYVRDMYSHYIPLRGWDGTTADQVWDYVGGGKGAFNQTLKTAHGRTSIADDPIAYIENMAESGILLNNKNWVKQHLMLLAQNHPTSLLTLSKAWYVKSTDANGNEEWIPATPQIASQMNSNQVKDAIDAFEKKMEQMAQTGDATQKRDGLNIAYPQTHSEEREHEVRVMKDGEEYVIYVNGDPQLAQAMNNTRAHRVREIQSGKLDRAAAWLGRKMAAAYTSLSPLFIPSNYFRDLTMTLASTAIREDAKYNYLLRKNLATSWNLGFMLRDYQNGKLREKVSNGNATPKEQMFYDFMMNGGETGFVSSLDVEDLKKKFKNDLKDLDRWKTNPVKVGHTIMDAIEFLNRAIEDSNRFAVYMTSIQYGRSIDEAVNDAKDVTLNFNRKGTGEYGWQTIRNLYLFINPAVQSLQTLGALAKHHPFKFTAVTASWIASGVLVPIVNAALMQMAAAFLGGDGDDDKDWYKDISKKYWQFSKWDRRNNFIMWVPTTHEFVKIPLAQEFRAFYGLGDMIASKMMGGELAEESWEDYGWDLVGQVVDMLPLDPTGYDGELGVSLMPNPIRPVFELAFNVDFTGKPLFKDTEYNKYDPNFTKAYVGTPDWLVRASRMMNSIGNDYPDVQQNKWDALGNPRYNLNNPAVVDHVLSSYLGGAYTMGSQVLGLLTKSLNDQKEIKMADIPVLSKFVSNPDDRPVSKKQGDEFWDKKEYYDRAANTISKLKKQAKIDGDYSLLERFYGSEEYKKYKLYEKDVNEYKEARKKERAEESGDEYRPHQLNAEDIYKNHATPMDEFEDMKLKQLFEKLNSFKTRYDAIVDNAPNESDGYYNTNKAAIDAIDEISIDKQEISELKKGFLDDGKDAYNAEDMKQIRELRKKILAVLEKANKVVVAKQKAKAEK